MIQTLLRRKSIADIDVESGAAEALAISLGGMHRNLTVWDLTSFGIAAVIGAGIFSTVGTAAFQGGPAVVWLFIITAIVCGLSAVCYAEFASQVPTAGSAYTYTYVSLGELLAWIIGWDLIMEYAIGNIAVAISWGDYFTSLLAGYGIHIPKYLTTDYVSAWRGYQSGVAEAAQAWATAPRVAGIPLICDLPALGIVLLITYVAYIGIKESKWTSNAMVALKILVILFVIAIGASYIQPHNWVPFAPNGVRGVFKGVSAVFFAYIGFDAISTTAEECKDPQRDLPRGMFYSLIICTLLYVAIALVITGIVNFKELQVGDPLAFVFGPKGANLPWVSTLVAASAVVAMASVLLVFQIGQPRIWMAMSRDGLLPKIFSKIHPRYRTPSFSTVMTGVMVAVPALFMNLTEVTDLTSIGTLFAFALVCGGVIRLHEQRRRDGEAPLKNGRKVFLVPIISSRIWVPAIFIGTAALAIYFDRDGVVQFFQYSEWHIFRERIPMIGFLLGMLYLTWKCMERDLSLIPCLGLASCAYLMTELGWTNWARFVIWLVIGLTIYFSYGRFHSKLNKA